MNIFSKGNMIYWEKVDSAAQYVIDLFISTASYRECEMYSRLETIKAPEFLASKREKPYKSGITLEQQIDSIIVPRAKTYYTFNDLTPIHYVMVGGRVGPERRSTHMKYKVSIIAEDRDGNILEQAKIDFNIER